MFTPQNLPGDLVKAINAGLGSLKVATPTDKVGIVSDAVATPQRTPDGSPIFGQVAVPQGAPVEPFIRLLIDTSAYNESVTNIECMLGDANQVHANGCFTCGASGNLIDPIIGSPTCNQYETFLQKLCNQPYTFAALDIEVKKAATNSSAGSTLELPEAVSYSRRNILGDGPVGNIQVSIYENREKFPLQDKKYVSVPLQNIEARFDNATKWTMSNLRGGRVYNVTLYTGSVQR